MFHLKSFDNFFHATKFVSQQTLSGNVVELCEGYPRMKNHFKIGSIFDFVMGQKTDEKSHKNGRFGIKNHIFRGLKSRGAIKNGRVGGIS